MAADNPLWATKRAFVENYEVQPTDVVHINVPDRWYDWDVTEDVKAFQEGMRHHGWGCSHLHPLAHPPATPTLTKTMTARVITTFPAVKVRSRCRGSGGGTSMRAGWGNGGIPIAEPPDGSLCRDGPEEARRVR